MIKKIVWLIMFVLSVFCVSAQSYPNCTYFNYSTFDAYVNNSWFENDTIANMTFFLDKLNERVIYLYNYTGWSSERTWGKKLTFLLQTSGGCSGGGVFFNWTNARTTITVSSPLYKFGCQGCSYYKNETSNLALGWGGELGDYCNLWGSAIHEITHAIMPKALLYRKWWTEGLASYWEWNIFVPFNNTNQITADKKIYIGTNFFNWDGFLWAPTYPGYIHNDYRDNGPQNWTIQESSGYQIGAYMLTMLRRDYDADFKKWFALVNDNIESLNYACSLQWNCSSALNRPSYYTDTLLITMWSRILGQDAIPIFRYDGPSGPGWGVRNFTNLDWLPDLNSQITAYGNIDTSANISAYVTHTGNFNISNVEVGLFLDGELISSFVTNFSVNETKNYKTNITTHPGEQTISILADYNDRIVEINETNNDAEIILQVNETSVTKPVPKTFVLRLSNAKYEDMVSGVTTFISSQIIVDGTRLWANPAAEWIIFPNRVIRIDSGVYGRWDDTDHIFIDSRITECNSTQCQFTNGSHTTLCDKKENYTHCIVNGPQVTELVNRQNIGIAYTYHLIDKKIRRINYLAIKEVK